MTTLYTDTADCLTAIARMIDRDGHQELFVTGPPIREIMDAVTARIDAGYRGKLRVVLPTLVHARSIGSSFLYQLVRLAPHMRMNKQAAHIFLVTRSEFLLFSVGNRDTENYLTAVGSEAAGAVASARALCAELWDASLPLRLNDPGSH